MSRYLVTGATGFLGSHLVRALADRGHEVVSFSRSTGGDVLDARLVRAAATGCDGAFHCAGKVSRRPEDAEELYRLHVEGTKTVLDACADAGVKRVVVASTSGTVAVSEDPAYVGTEDDPAPMALLARWPYYRAKLFAERAALEWGRIDRSRGATRKASHLAHAPHLAHDGHGNGVHKRAHENGLHENGVHENGLHESGVLGPQDDGAGPRPGDSLEVVSVNPSLLLGPGDVNGSSTDDVRRVLEGLVPIVPAGGLSFVDARDAAEAMGLAMDRGRPGHRYLVGACNLTVRDFFGRLARIAGVKAPVVPLPRSRLVARVGASLFERVASRVGYTEAIDPVSADMAQCFWYVDSSKAETELGWRARDPGETLLDTVQDLRDRGVVWPRERRG